MHIDKLVITAMLGLAIAPAARALTPVEDLLQEYRQQAALDFSAATGKTFWNQPFQPAGADEERRCAACHTTDPRQPGKHVTTGKEIKPLAPSVTSKRLTNTEKMRKWLSRNCTWTLGRECTAQEKGNVLMYLKDL
jgi:hypothetical protein